MTTFNLTGQKTAANKYQTQLEAIKVELLKRKTVWDRMPIEKKRAWIKGGSDPLFTLGFETYEFLRLNFFGAEDING